MKIAASKAAAAAIAQMRIAIARTMGLRDNGTKGPRDWRRSRSDG
jgi:hypothetical protein